MRQERFVARHGPEWDAFEAWLDARAGAPDPKRAREATRRWQGLRDEEMPGAYRRLCHQLSLARRRGYSPQVVDRLQGLMQRGHATLYRPPPVRWRAPLDFLSAGFPRLVRAEWRCMLASLLLFAIPLVGMFVLVLRQPELVHAVHSPSEVAGYEEMYDPGGDVLGRRDSSTDVQMFGFYVYNNVGIGLRTFAAGLLAGIGSAFVLLVNGVMIGSVAGHLQQIGYGDPFWRFVCGHSALELTAIVIAGGAGLQLGLRLVAPGNLRRRDALVLGGRRGGLLSLGVLVMLVLAAFVEAFWSSIGWMPASVKYAVAAVLWGAVLLWLWRGGRGHGRGDDGDAA